MPPSRAPSTSTPLTSSSSASLLAPGVAAKLALASAALVALPALAWTAARAGKLDALVAPLLGNGIQLDDSRRLVLAGGCAVVAVNLVMLLYVLSAFAEGGSGSGSGGGGSGSGEEKKKSK